MFQELNGKEILITGGTGSLGKTLTKLLVQNAQPHGIRIFSRDEFKHYNMNEEMNKFQEEKGVRVPISYLVGDVRDHSRLLRAFENVDIVINAAAMKQIGSCEINPIEAIQTNVRGAENVINAALERNVDKVMHISTDKAVHPVNLYGATKLCAEKAFIHGNVYSGRKRTRFSCCRYGNVLGSRGSVVPYFRQRILDNRSLTITHADMTRFWITLPRVGRFLLKRLIDMQGGEIFIPKMKSLCMVDLARYMSEKAPFEYIGIRAGEKLHECLIAPEEPVEERDDHYVVRPQGTHGKAYYSNTNESWIAREEFNQMLEDVI